MFSIISSMQYFGHTYIKKLFAVYLQLKLNWGPVFYLATLACLEQGISMLQDTMHIKKDALGDREGEHLCVCVCAHVWVKGTEGLGLLGEGQKFQ